MITKSKSARIDSKLVSAIRSEDKRIAEKALDTLFNKYNDSLVFHFRNLVKDEEMARELVLKAFEKASSNLTRYDEENGVFSTWFFRITKNIFIDNLRKRKLNEVFISDMCSVDEENHITEFDIECNDKSVEEEMIAFERNIKIMAVINNMKNPELAEVIKLRFFEGFSYEEIAKNIDKPLGTVKAFLYRAKEVLRDDLTDVGIGL